ncbi:hypothetical protein HKD24_05680 [Gluconobacter sp. LMG 31484]|uniref:Uncharacterized protein n=1 Tax=Gluconobacter vitians TaxID=2728102 RepID=A0ABR9Y514_9PROT|nr:hypothetical protein [Gluconobacter vitians]MBF0858703.1 hypothetical protein [Gluconobacter vitians]
MSDSTDQSDGTVSPSTIQNVRSELLNDDERKSYRNKLFWVFGIISLVFLLSVLIEIIIILSRGSLAEVYSNANWHIGIFIVSLLIILSSIGLTIFLSLLKMASFAEKQGEDADNSLDDLLPTTPQWEMIRNIMDACRGGT